MRLYFILNSPEMCDAFRWREEQIKLRSDHIASSLRKRPTAWESVQEKIAKEYGKLHHFILSLHLNVHVQELSSVELFIIIGAFVNLALL